LALTAIASATPQKRPFVLLLADHSVPVGIKPAKDIAAERFGAVEARLVGALVVRAFVSVHTK